jgi:hypothetical protein
MSYVPVTFAAVPVQGYGERANPPAAQALQAPVIDANFAALNTELAKLPTYSASTWRSFSQGLSTFGSAGAWHNFASTVWAPVSFTVPEWATAVVVAIGAGGFNTVSATSSLWIDASPSGAAVKVGGLMLRTLYRKNGGYWSSEQLWRVGTELNPNAVLTLQPRYMASAVAAGKVGCSRMMISAMALM